MSSQLELFVPHLSELQKLLGALRPASVPDFFVVFLCLWALVLWLTRGIWWEQPDPYANLWYEIPQLKNGGSRAVNGHTRNIAEHLDEVKKSIVVFWGSQSGTAERFAHRISRDLKLKLGLECLVADLSDYDASSIAFLTEQHLAIFMISTYGEGDPSDNASGLWDWLKTLHGQLDSLPKLKYLAFGLGNSTYLHYNKAVDVIDQRLRESGACSLAAVGKADDATGGTEEDFASWRDSTLSFLSAHFGVEIVDRAPEPTCLVEEDTSLDLQDLYLGEPIRQDRNAAYSPISTFPITKHGELFADASERNCLHLEVDLHEHAQVAYKTGDHFGVFAANPSAEVDALVNTLGLHKQRHVPITIKAIEAGVKVNVPSPTTIDALLRHYLEICAPVSRDTIQSLKALAPSSEAASWLDKLSKDPELYSAYLAEHHVTLGKILRLAVRIGDEETTWSKLTIGHLIDILPRMQPRYYSISSSSTVTPRVAHLTVLVAPQPLARSTSEVIPGLASSHLLQVTRQHAIDTKDQHQFTVPAPQNVVGFVRRSKFKLPTLVSCPLILVAAGTGFAPFRAFIQERARLRESGRDIGQMILFFGCQHPDRDQIYAEELRAFQNELGEKLIVHNAYSRVKPGKKTYVQHKLVEHGAEALELVQQGANLYVCGRTSMARDVAAAMRELATSLTGRSSSEAEAWVDSMKKSRKWQEDVWG